MSEQALNDVLKILRCPVTKSPLKAEAGALVSAEGARYRVVNGIPNMLPPSMAAYGERSSSEH